MKRKLLFGLLALMLVALPLCAACGESATPSSTSITIAFGEAGLNAVDPTSGNDNPYISINVFDCLVIAGVHGDTSSDIATWEELEGGKILECTLKQGIKFSSGDLLTADDVEFSWNRLMENDPSFASRAENFDRLEVVDEYTVRFHFTEPTITAYYQTLSYPFVTSKAYYDRVGEDEFARLPVGTGPYKIVDWEEGQYVELAANENYWGDQPEITEARLEFAADSSVRIAMLQAGEVDMVVGAPWQMVAEMEEAGYKRQDFPKPQGYSLQFNLMNPNTPWADLKVRQAIAYAIDKESIIEDLFYGIPTSLVWLLPDELGYDSELESYPYDMEKAKELMDDAGYADGFDMPLYYYPSVVGLTDLADYLSSVLLQLGIECELIPMEFGPAMMETVMQWRNDPTAEAVQLQALGFVNMPDPVVGLQMVFDSRNVTSLYGRDDLNAIIDQAGAAFDNTERGELIKQAFRIINEDLPVIPILAGVEVYLMNSNVDYDPPPTFMPRPCVKYMSFND